MKKIYIAIFLMISILFFYGCGNTTETEVSETEQNANEEIENEEAKINEESEAKEQDADKDELKAEDYSDAITDEDKEKLKKMAEDYYTYTLKSDIKILSIHETSNIRLYQGSKEKKYKIGDILIYEADIIQDEYLELTRMIKFAKGENGEWEIIGEGK